MSTTISVAFDTTFVGLILSIFGMLLLHYLQERQELYVQEEAARLIAAITRAQLLNSGQGFLREAWDPQPAEVHGFWGRLKSASRFLRVSADIVFLIAVALVALYLARTGVLRFPHGDEIIVQRIRKETAN